MPIEDKILNGYCYHYRKYYPDGELEPNERPTSVITGSGGAKLLISKLRENGYSDEEIGNMLTVYTDDWGQLTLNQVQITKKDLGNSEK